MIEYINANDMMFESFALGKKIYDWGVRPTHIVSLWRGGASVGVCVHEYFKSQSHYANHISIATASYTDMGSQNSKVVVKAIFELTRQVQQGDTILIIDDIYDSGSTIEAVISSIKKETRESNPQIIIGCLYNKLRSRKVERRVIALLNKEDHWISFPHEIADLVRVDGKVIDDSALQEKSEVLYQILNKSFEPVTMNTPTTSEELLFDGFRLAMKLYDDGFIPDFIVAVWEDGASTATTVDEYYKYKGKLEGRQSCIDSIAIDPNSSVEGSMEYLRSNIKSTDKLLVVATNWNGELSSFMDRLSQMIQCENIKSAAIYYDADTPNYFIRGM